MIKKMNELFPVSVKLRNVFVAVGMSFVVMSCSLDNNDQAIVPVKVAYVSLYNASPDAPALDIMVDNNRINQNPFDYTDHSGYLNFYTGDRNFKFNSNNAINALVDTTFNLVDGKSYSLFVINRLPKLEALLVRDSASAPAAGHAMVRFVNLSPDAPPYTANMASASDSTTFQSTAFKAATDFVEVPANSYSINLKKADSGAGVLEANAINFASGRYYTIIVRGFVNPPESDKNSLSLEVL
jgi:hypothetical protein